MILGLGTDNTLLMRKTPQAPWEKLGSRPPALAAMIVLRNGVIVGVGKDTMLWKQELSGTYKQIPNSHAFTGGAALPDGTLVGLGTDRQLYTRTTLSGRAVLIPGSGSVMSIAVMPNGTIIGVGMDNQLYTRATLTSPWALVPGSGSVKSVAVTPEGTIVGVGMDNQLYTRATLTSPWALVPGSGPVVSVAAYPVACEPNSTTTAPPQPQPPKPPKLGRLVVKQYYSYTSIYELPIEPNSSHTFREPRPQDPFEALVFYIYNQGEGDLQLLGATLSNTSSFVLTQMEGTPTGPRPRFPSVIPPGRRDHLYLVYMRRNPGPKWTTVQLQTTSGGRPPELFTFTVQIP